ncbi:unnamed protein product [Hermetia illucens]|uniref:Presequence protease, mitochondrial n=1 Tax=Hermetia illucens TaxID=343691 RepID=A0A7R8UVI2_HERIL|nr:uncharacterized protein C05D11.1-like [Hermetia illucens]CAD7087874.1 unnamed protein product [Hermetia illucens]
MSFKLVAKATVDDSIEVSKFRSEATGLSVVIAEVEGPVVNGHFALATEAHDDDGLPHTLEHLIFLGSENYPYKGVLDLLANRCLASGTNAWTDTDHTCYTMTTAGSDGFLALMPIYLDHILYPTLSDSGFLTEVHHISGEGEDGGVVYCEMQGRENTGESRTHLQLLRAAYPNSGYSAETGGIMHNLRTSTNNEKVRNYHAAFYRPENLTVIITGKIDAEKVFEALKPIEKKILSKGKKESFRKPWQTPVASLEKAQDIKVVYPSDEEDCGLVYVGFRGPNCADNHSVLTACNILLRYLTDTSVSPLEREFVEIEDPYASKVSHAIIENLSSLLCLLFENVPVNKIDDISGKLKEILSRFAKGDEKIDMHRMHYIIEKEILEALSSLESNPHDAVAFLIIGDVLYGRNEKDFVDRLNTKKILEALLSKPADYWVDLLKTYLVDANEICVRGYPSIEEQARMSKEEIERIEKQRNTLGPEGLQAKGTALMEAMAKNEEQPPESMLTQVPVPSTEDINFHYLKIYKATDGSQSIPCVDFNDFPVYAEIYDIHTNFIYLIVTLNTGSLDTRLRPYLLLLLTLILESPIRRDDQLIPYEEVVAALEKDTISTGSSLGVQPNSSFNCEPFSNTAVIMLQVEPKKYETGVNWMREILHSTEFVTERVRVCASKMHNAVSQAKRKGNSIVRDLLKAMYYENDTNIRVSSMLKQQKFLKGVLDQLDGPDSQNVLNDLNTVRKHLLGNQNVAVHIAANLKKLSENRINISSPWRNVTEKSEISEKNYSANIIPDWKVIKPEGIIPEIQGTVVGLGCIESAFLFHAAPSINDFMHPDLPALMLYLQYLTQLEGPLWRQIRGQGFAYGYNIIPRPNEGLLCLTLYRATNVVAAFKEAKNTIEAQLAAGAKWDSNLLESARSSLIFEIIEREKSVGNLIVQGLLTTFKNVPADYNQLLVKKVNAVDTEQLDKVGKLYISKLFAPQAKTAIVCHPDKVKENISAFAAMNRELVAAASLEESILAK